MGRINPEGRGKKKMDTDLDIIGGKNYEQSRDKI